MKFKDLKDFPYTSSFASIPLKPIVTQEADKYLATASLDQIRKFVPDIPDGNYYLLPIAFNACVVNRVNKNDDVISTETALATYKNFLFKQINIEHNRKNVVGVILNAGFTEFGTDKTLSEEDIKGTTKPFNITLGGVVWRIVNDDLADFIEESNDPTSPHYLEVSASWEVGFTDYKLAVLENGKKNLEDALIISDAEEIDKFKQLLKAYQGNGRVDENKRVYRVPTENFIPLGIGLTEKPAAEVEGVAVPLSVEEEASAGVPPQFQKKEKDSEEQDPEKKKEGDEEETDEKKKKGGKNPFPPKKKDSKEDKSKKSEEDEEENKKKKDGGEDVTVTVTVDASENHNKNQKNISHASESHVNEGVTMTIKTLEDLAKITDDGLKQANAASIAEVVQQHLTLKAEEYAKEKSRWENELNTAKTASQAATASLEDFKKKFDEVQAKVAALEAEKVEKEKVEKFNARMSEIVAAYNLDDEARAAVVEDIKAIASDEDFDKYKKKASILFKGFAKTEVKKEEKKQEEAAASVVDDAIEKGKKEGGLPNSSTSSQTKTLAELAKQAFAKENYTVNYR
jgi:hypothetical protein